MSLEYIDDLTRAWARKQSENLNLSYYLYFRPSKGVAPGELRILTQTESNFQLADPQRIMPTWTPAAAANWIRAVATRLPILPAKRIEIQQPSKTHKALSKAAEKFGLLVSSTGRYYGFNEQNGLSVGYASSGPAAKAWLDGYRKGIEKGRASK